MGRNIASMSAEFLELKAVQDKVAKLPEAPTREGNRAIEREANTLGKRLTNISRQLADLPAASTDDLVHKARVTMEYLTEDNGLPSILSISLCSDVIKCLDRKIDRTEEG